eukprot:COSAG01_NODE_33782_length_558_cov_3.082789_1_plen_42_part_01
MQQHPGVRDVAAARGGHTWGRARTMGDLAAWLVAVHKSCPVL